jgi:hypothetical protein
MVALLLPAIRCAVATLKATEETLPSMTPEDTALLMATSADVCTDTPAAEGKDGPMSIPCNVITMLLVAGSALSRTNTTDA